MPYSKYKKGEKHMPHGVSHKGMSQGYRTKSGYAGKGSGAKRKALRRMMSMYKSGKYATGNVIPGAGNPKKIKAGYKKTKKKMMGAAYNHGA